MSELRTLTDRISTCLFSIPAVAQWWAKCLAVKMESEAMARGSIPFTRLNKPLSECKAALVTTGGIHLHDQKPYDMQSSDGDASYREIPNHVSNDLITITHKYYDHSDADRDLNVIFPLQHFRELVSDHILGSLSRRHFSFMGHIDGPMIDKLRFETAPEVASKLRMDGADFAFLTPA